MADSYLEGAVEILDEWFKDRVGKKLALLPGDYIEQVEGKYFISSGGKRHESDISTLHNIHSLYGFLADNVQLLEEYKEPEEAKEQQWIIEPEEINSRGEVIGAIGVAEIMDIDDGKTAGIMFLSSDGGFSAITLYREGEPEEICTAIEDLEKTVETVQIIIAKLRAKYNIKSDKDATEN